MMLVLLAYACDPPEPKAQPGAAKADSVVVATQPPAVTDGPVAIKGPDGKLRIEGNMRNGQRHGVWTSYHPNGTIASRSAYVDGRLNGVTVVFHTNGQLYYTGDYRMGKQVGDWRFYDEEGTLLKTVHYDSTGTVINDR